MTDMTEVDTTGAEEVKPGQSEARDYAAEARDLGWRPKEEFKGDEKLWVDAETFVKRGEEVMPILKSQLKTLKQELADLRKQSVKASEFFSTAEKRAYERALADLTNKAAAAADVGDSAGVKAAMAEVAKLEKPASPDAGQEISKEEFVDWRIENDWYGTDPTKSAYADLIADKLAAQNGGRLTKGAFEEITRAVAEKFKTQPKPKAVVEGASAPRPGRGGKSFADLPADAQRTCDKWVKNGLIKSRDDYVKNYDWSNS